eukprot:860393_1
MIQIFNAVNPIRFRVNLVMNITDRSENLNNRNKITTDIDGAFTRSLSKRKEAVSKAENEVKDAVEKHKKDMEENLMGQQVKLKNVERDYKRYNQLQEEKKDVNSLLSIGKSVVIQSSIIQYFALNKSSSKTCGGY